MGVVNFSLGKLEQNVQKRQEYFENAAKNFEESLNYFDPDDLLDIASSKSHLGSSLIEIAILTGKKSSLIRHLRIIMQFLKFIKTRATKIMQLFFSILGCFILTNHACRTCKTMKE